MMGHHLARGALAVALLGILNSPLQGQIPAEFRDYPLGTLRESGDLVAPYFDGWYDNGDGTVSYSFGFMNRNTKELVDIPLGPNNYIEPAEYDGVQPTHFPVYDRGGLHGKRERGAFEVTVPMNPDGAPEVWWTLAHAGRTYSVPGRATSPAYEMSRDPAAFGTLPPGVRFDDDGPESIDREGIVADPVTTSVGTPVVLSALVRDRGVREPYEGDNFVPVTATFIWHQGPGQVTFAPESVESEGTAWGEVETEATFAEPGAYVVRVRVDNFEAPDSKFDNQCCWSNAFIPVTVTP